jgi:radical SAM superfamily enzyme YgiQ (UPF0313 family)
MLGFSKNKQNFIEEQAVDVLFLHQGMQGVYSVFPMGVFALLSALHKAGFSGRAVNLDVERKHDKKITLQNILQRYRPRLLALDLHWYVHSHCQIELARQLKKITDTPLILGGYTSSFFADEILRDYPFIDGVLCGEADSSIVEYLKVVTNGGDPAKVPGLVYRKGEKIESSQASAPSKTVLDALDYADLDSLDHWQDYVSTSSGAGATIFIYPEQTPKATFFLSIGRGCSVNCSYCTAAASSVRNFFGRRGCYYRPAEAVAEDFARLADRGIETVLAEYYPYPADDDYFEEVFARIREKKVDVGINFGCWSLPSDRFIEAYSRTFNMRLSCLSFSPESGSERIREINKGKAYSNREVYRLVDKLTDNNIFASVHFGFGFPFESPTDFEQTLAMHRQLRGRRLYLSIRAIPLEPGSQMFLHPDKYRIIKHWTEFADYKKTFADLSRNKEPKHPYGYDTHLLDKKQLDRMKIAAYRAFYLNIPLIRQRLSWVGQPGGKKLDYFKIGGAIVLGSASLLNRWER